MSLETTIEQLEAENTALHADLARAKNAVAYRKRIDALMRKGMSRPQAAAQAGREHQNGRRDFLLRTNRPAMAETVKQACKPKRRVVNR